MLESEALAKPRDCGRAGRTTLPKCVAVRSCSTIRGCARFREIHIFLVAWLRGIVIQLLPSLFVEVLGNRETKEHKR